MQFWGPVQDGTTVGSFARWEQAFRVFSNVYLRVHPQKAAELVQYNHIIHNASQTFVWDNVYSYDKDIAVFPSCSWGIILQQAWIFRLKEKLRGEHGHSQGHVASSEGNKYETVNRDRLCHRFNKGKSTYGANCKFDHRCKYCGKWGHGVTICRKLKAEKGGNGEARVSSNGPD